jgi:G:T-mismatch repair DNA endonuclease (very short patch repair protein)
MADVHTKDVRSYNMSQIRSKNTKPELVVRKYLIEPSYLFMDVFGMGMKGVNILIPAFGP